MNSCVLRFENCISKGKSSAFVIVNIALIRKFPIFSFTFKEMAIRGNGIGQIGA